MFPTCNVHNPGCLFMLSFLGLTRVCGERIALRSCPDEMPIPPGITSDVVQPLECWAFKENRHCYCFSPFVFVYENETQQQKITFQTFHWIPALEVCSTLNMKMVAIETQEENEMLAKHIINQNALGLTYWTSGLYRSGNTPYSFIWGTFDANAKKVVGPAFTYSNWGSSYSTFDKQERNAVMLNCTSLVVCQWEVHSVDNSYGILCEAELDPNFKIPYLKRPIVIKSLPTPAAFPQQPTTKMLITKKSSASRILMICPLFTYALCLFQLVR